ncbi:MAG: hypothetical protein C7M88_09805 [Candidatus Arcticimaribacter sp.]|nr:MAG: hypothetical protein C7M88_09805 [Candidatus Arcticimaribacter sp.]PTM00285.1 MAG: hypothetical protein DA394_05470 [Candidatus Arcticimaribacter sp.]
MRKVIFYLSLIVSISLLWNIIRILGEDLDRLTQYGYGYLVGKIILFSIFLTVVLFTRKSISK